MSRSFSFHGVLLLAGGLLVAQAGCQSSDDDGGEPRLPTAGSSTDADSGSGPFDEAGGEFTTTASGLKYRITREGDGEKPQASDRVRVHYEGKLADGSIFDSSYPRGQPVEFPLEGVISGWTEGLQLVKVGGMIELIIPADLGYGANPRPGSGIPPGATLYFTVELLGIQ